MKAGYGAAATGRPIVFLFFWASIPAVFGGAADSGIAGRIYDPQGRAAAGATVRLSSAAAPAGGETRADDQGAYQLAAPPGRYLVTAEAPGFEPVTRTVTAEP